MWDNENEDNDGDGAATVLRKAIIAKKGYARAKKIVEKGNNPANK